MPVSGSTSAAVAGPITVVTMAAKPTCGATRCRTSMSPSRAATTWRSALRHTTKRTILPPTSRRHDRTLEGVDHCGHLRVRFAEKIENTLCGQVASHLLPHDVAQFHLRDIQPDPQRHREVHQLEAVGDDEHAVDGDLDADDIVAMRWGLMRHVCPVCICSRKASLIASSAWSSRFVASVSLSHKPSEIAAIFVAAFRRAASTASSALAEAEAMLP